MIYNRCKKLPHCTLTEKNMTLKIERPLQQRLATLLSVRNFFLIIRILLIIYVTRSSISNLEKTGIVLKAKD
jgi:hypothetical protein